MKDISNSDFDVNILQDATKYPKIELTFPLPTDQETYIDIDANEKLSNNFKILENFINFISWGSVNFGEIYSTNEYQYSVHKYTPQFNHKMRKYMDESLEKSEKLNRLVSDLIDQELRLNLIKAKDYNNRFNEVKRFMVNYYKKENEKNMPTFASHNFLRICYVTVMKLFVKMFPKGVWCKKEEFSLLYKKYLEDPMSIIYLPNHQSHIDYIIIHLVTIRFQLATPTVIAGDNLNVAVFGTILKNLGAIFIKRSFNNELYTETNLSSLLEFIILNKIGLEVFIEGTRSRDGKLLLPKYGILKTLTNVYLKQVNIDKNRQFDMLIQPLSITYERIYETDGYLNELLGYDKKQESFTGIIKNGVTNFFNKRKALDNEKDIKKRVTSTGDYDNTSKALDGKIFVKLGESFKMSEFVNDKSNLVDISDSDEDNDCPINLKKMGFKVLHEINRISYLPEIALVGSAIQTFYYLNNKKEFNVQDVLPTYRVLANAFKNEESDPKSTNIKLINGTLEYSDDELINMFKEQISQFLRYIKINFKTNNISIKTSIELIYYKNLTIHLIIHKCLACFLILRLKDSKMRTFDVIHKLFYIFTGFLKNEFLFDYNYNQRNGLSVILKDLVNENKIKVSNNVYEVIDVEYLETFSAIIQPFFLSYEICINELRSAISIYFNATGQTKIDERLLASDAAIYKEYPHTKTLLKLIQRRGSKSRHIESVNKQYLLSCLYYLNNLRLIKIFKNRAKTRAYVLITTPKDLVFVQDFVASLLNEHQLFLTHRNVNYMVDIINKNFDRSNHSTPKL